MAPLMCWEERRGLVEGILVGLLVQDTLTAFNVFLLLLITVTYVALATALRAGE